MKADVRLYTAIGVAIGLLLVFSPIWLSDNILAGDDLLDYFYPMEHYLHTSMAQGQVPLWNPYTFSGTPFIANMQVGIFYPIHFLLRWLKPESFFPVSIFIHVLISTVGMMVCARSFGLNKFGAAFAGLAWAGSGALLPKMLGGQMPVIFSTAWLPIVIYFWVRLVQNGKMKTGVFLGLTMALQFLAGSSQIFYMTFLTGLFCFIIFILNEYIAERNLRKSGIKVLISIFSVIIFLGLVSVQLLMTYQWIKLSFSRSAGLDINTVLKGAWDIEHLMSLIIPDFFLNKSYPPTFNITRNIGFWEVCPYFGLIALMAVPFAGIRNKSLEFDINNNDNGRKLVLLSVIGIIAFLTSLGLAFPFRFSWYFIPGFNMFRVPARWIMISIWAFCILAGSGASAWADKRVDPRIKRFRITQNMVTFLNGIALVFILILFFFYEAGFGNRFIQLFSRAWLIGFLCVILVLLYKRRKLSGKIFRFSILLLIGIELLVFSFKCPSYFKEENWNERIKEPQVLADIENNNRILCTDSVFSDTEMIPLLRNHNIINEHETIRGYDPVIYGRYVRYINVMSGRPADASVGGMLNIPGIKNMNMARRLGIGTIIDRDKTRRDFHTRAIPMPEPWPKYRLARNIITPGSDLGEQWLGYIYNKVEYNDRVLDNPETVHLNRKVSYYGKPRTKVEADRIEVLSQSSDEQILEVSTVKDSVLVTDDLYYPGWKVAVDGKDVRLLRADYLFRGVALKAGSHRVHFKFWPTLLKYGTWITIISILLCIIILMNVVIREKRKAENV